MRNAACASWQSLVSDPRFVFLTGDLGYKALEPLREQLGPRFINAGVAEQNMISAAAGMARQGFVPWAYSIAPFAYARPFEQIRNDVCLNRLPVRIVGNGGGYAYGPMGATHHAIEDYGVMLTLQGMQAYVPAFDEDVMPIVRGLAGDGRPAYLRLGYSELPTGQVAPAYDGPCRRLTAGGDTLLIAVGPLAGGIWREILAAPSGSVGLWVVTELPFGRDRWPAAFREAVARARVVGVAEEHVRQGSFGSTFAQDLLESGWRGESFRHFCAAGYPSGTYGSQAFHRRESGLGAAQILSALAEDRAP